MALVIALTHPDLLLLITVFFHKHNHCPLNFNDLLELFGFFDDRKLIINNKNTLKKCLDGILRSVHKPKFKLYIPFSTNLLSLHRF